MPHAFCKQYALLFLYLGVGFVPYFYTIDIIGAQWFYLSILNFIFIVYFLTSKYSLIIFNSFISNVVIKLFLTFLFFSLISLIFTKNLSLSLVDLSRQFIVLFSLLNLTYLFSVKKFVLINFSYLVSIVLLIELLFSFYPLVEYLIYNPLFEIDLKVVPYGMKGIAGNKNVLAANYSFKLPFILYLLFNTNGLVRYFYSFLFTALMTVIYLLTSRAAYLSSAFVIMIFLIYYIYKNFNLFKKSIFFFLTPFLFLALVIYTTNLISELSKVDSKLTTLTLVDESSNNRLILYENALDYISKNPFFGCGIGNWKVESLPYWKSLMTGYIVPYHAHNDFLEITAEIGIFGGLSYFLIFVYIFFWCIKEFYLKENFISVFIFSITSAYFIDAMLNFPIERALSQINFIVLVFFFYLASKKNVQTFS